MRVLFVVLVTIALPALAQKQPWEWTIEERIAARTDPAKISIGGLTEPELFLPTEILTHFVSRIFVVNDEAANGFRMDAEARAAEAGLPGDFLTVFEREASTFIAAQQRDHQLREGMSNGSMNVHRAIADLNLLERTERCPLRFALVERMRELYGVKFDRFLYDGIARAMSRTYFGDPPTVDELSREASGCQ